MSVVYSIPESASNLSVIRIDESHGGHSSRLMGGMRTPPPGIERSVMELVEDLPPSSTRCAHCAGVAPHANQEMRQVRLGDGSSISIWRASYTCSRCGQTTIPFDERLEPVRSLGRLRQRVMRQPDFPVDELARAWDLGRMHRLQITS